LRCHLVGQHDLGLVDLAALRPRFADLVHRHIGEQAQELADIASSVLRQYCQKS
jgi:hypothetical protein